MAVVNLGGNNFFGVPFPVVVADRFFHIYDDGGQMAIDVFRWDESEQRPVYEVRASEPLADNINTNPTGIVTFTHEESGAFLFKFRPKPGVSQIFGRIPAQDEVAVRVTDHDLKVSRSGVPIVTIARNQFSGLPIGIRVEADGSVGIGVNWLPEGMTLLPGPE